MRTRLRVTATRPNPAFGSLTPWGDPEPAEITMTWYSGDADGRLSQTVTAVQSLMSERGYTAFSVVEEPDE